MKIGVHLVHLRPGRIGGAEQYVRNLIEFAVRKRSNCEMYLFLHPDNTSTFREENGKLRKIVVRTDRDLHSQLHHWIRVLELDIWFCPLAVVEPYAAIPTVVTIHDIQHEIYPRFFSPAELQSRNRYLRMSARYADAILTVSQYSKKTLIEQYGLPDDRIHAVHSDADRVFQARPDEPMNRLVKAKYRLPERYGLYPANFWPHKNHLNLLRALVVLRDRDKRTVSMVFTGDWQLSAEAKEYIQEIKHYIQAHGLGAQIYFTGYVPQEEVPYLYRNAEFLAFPSLFEGFGIPLVEAMKSRLPIVCSNAASLPEVAGDSALLFDPEDPFDIAAKLVEVQDPSTRERLIRSGERRAADFSWDNTTEVTFHVFDSLLSGGIDMRIARKLQMIFQLEGYEFVTELYREFLNREPDPGGLQDHVNLLASGMPKINIVLGIMMSQEAQSLYSRGY
ncbi:glycosyltransferase [Paenibacillus sp. HJGM_3]|uniref:glycosyltransferase n=1 Tax=Paenibacillus sp. HJGM_3 TaxID=3379816 RepID=UPI0038585F1B